MTNSITLLLFILSNLYPILTTGVTQTQAQCTVSASGVKVCTNEEVTSEAVPNNEGIENCKDNNELCSHWASIDECSKNPNYMLQNCAKSCNLCQDTLVDGVGLTKEQQSEKESLLVEISQYGEEQEAEGEIVHETLFVIRKSVDYMKNYVHAELPSHQMSEDIINACRNKYKLCSFWAALGECENNAGFMVTNCAPACLSCDKIDYSTRCKNIDPNATPGLFQGEMNLMFQKIVENAPGNRTDATQFASQERQLLEDGTPIYTVTVHSRPKTPTPLPSIDSFGIASFDKFKDESEDPWVVTFDNFLTEEECTHLINMGYKNGYKRSADVGAKQVDGSYDKSISKSRTSENSWCDFETGCRNDPVVQRVMKRIQKVTGVPTDNYEDLQLLKYEIGQFYTPHHDILRSQSDRPCGPRILTFFLYLSDVEEGGETRLNDLNIEIKPKMGRALLWPSTMSYDPSEKDPRTRHEALPVKKGTKFAANAWIHLFDFVGPQKQGCN